jgi:hypothetical protein
MDKRNNISKFIVIFNRITGILYYPLQNSVTTSTTGVSPFFANKGYNPAFTVHSKYELASLKAVTDLQELHNKLQVNIQEFQERYQQSTDKNRIPPPEFKVGDKALLKAKFF